MLRSQVLPGKHVLRTILVFCCSLYLPVTSRAATIVVDPSGKTLGSHLTIQDAVDAAASAGDVVSLMPGTYVATDPSDGAVVDVYNKSLVLESSTGNPLDVVIDGQHTRHGVFMEGTSSSGIGVVISGVTITNGDASQGGGIHANVPGGYFVLIDSIVSQCAASTGGGLSLLGGSHYLVDVTIEENEAGHGGGLDSFESDTVLLYRAVIKANTASGNGGGCRFNRATGLGVVESEIVENHAISGDGGGITLAQTSTRFFLTSFNLNTASGLGGNLHTSGKDMTLMACGFWNGNANYGGGLYANACDVRLYYSGLAGNHASRGGGGIHSTSSTVMLDTVVLLANTTTGTLGSACYFNACEVDMEDSYVTLNTGASRGSISAQFSELRLSRSSFAWNESVDKGGAIALEASDSDVESCRFNGNRSFSGGAVFLNGYRGPATASFIDCEFNRNESWAAPHDLAGGGAMFLAWDVTAEIQRCKFDENIASGNGSGIYCAGDANATITNECLFRDNYSPYKNTGAIDIGSAARATVSYNFFCGNLPDHFNGIAWGIKKMNSFSATCP